MLSKWSTLINSCTHVGISDSHELNYEEFLAGYSYILKCAHGLVLQMQVFIGFVACGDYSIRVSQYLGGGACLCTSGSAIEVFMWL